MLNSGSLRHVIEIYREQVASSGPHGDVTDWALQQTRRARVIPVTVEGKAKYQQAGYSEVEAKILFRNMPDIELDDRIVWVNRRYNPEYRMIKPASSQDGKFRNSTVLVKSVPKLIVR